MRKKFFTKKVTLIVLASMIGSSIVAAGCGATNTEEDKPTTTAYEEANTYSETDVQQTESQSTESSVVMGDNSEEEPIIQDGNYIYTIGDGSVTLALKTNIYDYLETVPEYKNGQYKRFAMEKLAPELGWTSQYGSEMDKTYYAECNGEDIALDIGKQHNLGQKGANGKIFYDDISVGVSMPEDSVWFLQKAPERASYLHSSKKYSITFDEIVVMTFILEHKDELRDAVNLCETYFGNWRDSSQQFPTYLIP